MAAPSQGELLQVEPLHVEALQVKPLQVEPPAGLLEALGAKPLYVGKNQFDFIVELATASGLSRGWGAWVRQLAQVPPWRARLPGT